MISHAVGLIQVFKTILKMKIIKYSMQCGMFQKTSTGIVLKLQFRPRITRFHSHRITNLILYGIVYEKES